MLVPILGQSEGKRRVNLLSWSHEGKLLGQILLLDKFGQQVCSLLPGKMKTAPELLPESVLDATPAEPQEQQVENPVLRRLKVCGEMVAASKRIQQAKVLVFRERK